MAVRGGGGGAAADHAVCPGRDHRRRRARRFVAPRAAASRRQPVTSAARSRAASESSPSRHSSPCSCCCRSPAPRTARPRQWSIRSTATAHSCSAAATSCCRCCTRASSTRAGFRTISSWRATARRRPCRGRLFSFAAYLGAIQTPAPNGVPGAVIALLAIYLPSFLLIFGTLPFWHWLRRSPSFGKALAGTNAVVVGILVAALYTPIWTSAITGVLDVVVAAVALLALHDRSRAANRRGRRLRDRR